MINLNSKIGQRSQVVVQSILQIMIIEEKFISKNDRKVLSEYETLQKDMRETISDINLLTMDGTIRQLSDKIISLQNNHAIVFKSVEKNISVMNKNKESLNTKIQQISDILNNVIRSVDKQEAELMMTGELLGPLTIELRYEIKNFKTLWNETLLNIQRLLLFSETDQYGETKKNINEKQNVNKKNVEMLLQTVNNAEFDKFWQKMNEYLPEINQLEDSLFADWKKNRELLIKLEEIGTKVRITTLSIAGLAGENVERSISTGNFVSLSLASCGLISLSILSFFLYRAIMTPVNRVIEGLTKSAEQVSLVSGQVSSSSHSLAAGSSEQAASSEDISSSLEEVSSKAIKNADHAKHADNYMTGLKQTVEFANSSMSELSDSMNDIFRVTGETSELVRTIDEIAFQTNLLALNAAIEAARAGEAGAGFSVVAEEVRNLSISAAKVAKNTSELIDDIIRKIKNGSELVSGTGESFAKVAENSVRAAVLIGEIATASDDQANHVEQVNRAVTEIDKVIQKNAANAEEAASATGKMNAQSEHMKGFVKELAVLVGGC